MLNKIRHCCKILTLILSSVSWWPSWSVKVAGMMCLESDKED